MTADTDPGEVPADRADARPGSGQFTWELPFPDEEARRAAWKDMLFNDEGLVRIVIPNMHKVSDRAWRSGQPNPWHLRRFARRGGKTVISLRNGRNFGALPLEIEACHRLGLAFHVAMFRSRRLPTVEQIRDFHDLLARIDYPVLFHCKAGADRTAFAAALYLVFQEGAPIARARKQLSIWYGHIAAADTGVLDAFFDAYEADTAREPMSLMEWVETRYDPEAISDAFEPKGLARWLVDKVLQRE